MKNEFINTANTMKFNAICEEMESPRSLVGPSMALVTGAAGRGKTEAAKRYAVDGNAIFIPTKPWCSATALLKEITFELAKVRPSRRDACEDVIADEMRKHRRLLIIDEADLMKMDVLEILRSINERYRCPVLFIGEDALKGRLASRRRLQDRIRRSMEFGPVMQQDVAFYFKQNFSLNIDKDVSASILRYGKGTWRRVLKFAVAVEQTMQASNVAEISPEMATMVIKDLEKDEHGRQNS